MDFSKLENNIIDVIKEEQLKLGYQSEIIRLYYPLSSLNRFLQTDDDIDMMMEHLKGFVEYTRDRLGDVEVFNTGDRFGIKIPSQGADYVHEHMDNSEFISEFIKVIANHRSTMEDVTAVFKKHSKCVHIEKMNNGEFDYLYYFEDGEPDEYMYCITDEGFHIIYHRYTKEDYNEFGF